MALVLAVVEGDQIFIEDEPITVNTIYGDGRCDLTINGIRHEIGDSQSLEIMPKVRVSAGLLGSNSRQLRLIFKAPRSITIWREKEYWERKNVDK